MQYVQVTIFFNEIKYSKIHICYLKLMEYFIMSVNTKNILQANVVPHYWQICTLLLHYRYMKSLFYGEL